MDDPDYIAFNPSQGWPAGERLFYECTRCGGLLPSAPKDKMYCRCRNIVIDVESGRLSVKDQDAIRLIRIN